MRQWLTAAWLVVASVVFCGAGAQFFTPPLNVVVTSAAPPSISFRPNGGTLFYDNNASATTYNFTTVDLGSTGNSRSIGVCVHTANNGATVSSATIDGISAAVQNTATGGTNETSAFITARVNNSDTTGTVSVTLSGASGGFMSIGVWAMYNLTSTTKQQSATSTAGTATLSINLNAGDVMTVCGNGNAGSTSGTTGYTSRYSGTQGGGFLVHGGDFTETVNEAPRTVQFVFNTATVRAAISQSFR